MEPRPTGPTGLLGNLRAFTDGLLTSAHDRIQLLSVELSEEKHRLIQISFWVAAIVVLAILALVFGSLAVLVIFWETARVGVVVSLALFYLAALVAAAVAFSGYLKRQPKPFAATIEELKSDRECTRSDS